MAESMPTGVDFQKMYHVRLGIPLTDPIIYAKFDDNPDEVEITIWNMDTEVLIDLDYEYCFQMPDEYWGWKMKYLPDFQNGKYRFLCRMKSDTDEIAYIQIFTEIRNFVLVG